jgi:hypothetical protein
VNGLPVSGKVYLQGSRGRTPVKVEGDPGDVTSDCALEAVAAIAQCDPFKFDELLRVVRLMPPPQRGRRPGSTVAGGAGTTPSTPGDDRRSGRRRIGTPSSEPMEEPSPGRDTASRRLSGNRGR